METGLFLLRSFPLLLYILFVSFKCIHCCVQTKKFHKPIDNFLWQYSIKTQKKLNVLLFLLHCSVPSIVLYCIVLYCTVLYCIVLYCTVLLYCIVLFSLLLYCVALFSVLRCFLYCILLYAITVLSLLSTYPIVMCLYSISLNSPFNHI